MASRTQSVMDGDNSSGTTLNLTAFTATAGRTIVVTAGHETSDVTMSVTDTAGNTYVALTERAHSNGDNWVQIFYAKNITGHAANVVTITFSSAVSYRAGSAREYSGLSTSAPFEVEDWKEEASSATCTVPAMTASGSGVIVAVYKAYNDSDWTAGTDFTDLKQVVSGGAFLHASQDRIIGSGGSYTAPITRGSATALLGAAAVFVDVAGGGGGDPEGRLVGGKLINGGLLIGGVL